MLSYARALELLALDVSQELGARWLVRVANDGLAIHDTEASLALVGTLGAGCTRLVAKRFDKTGATVASATGFETLREAAEWVVGVNSSPPAEFYDHRWIGPVA